MSWTDTNTEPATSWTTTAEVEPGTSYTTAATNPSTSYTTTTTPAQLTWNHFAYLLWAEGENRMWDQLEFQWGI